MGVALRSNASITFQCVFHVEWCPKYRQADPGLEFNAIETRLRATIWDVFDETGSWPIEMKVLPDHVHLLVEVDPLFEDHELVKVMKGWGRNSRLMRQGFPVLKTRLSTFWTDCYFVATVGGAPVSVITRYVENQKSV